MDSNDKANTADDKQLALRQEIPNYGNKLLKRLDEFRKTTILFDVRVRAEGGEFNAHKVILAACGGIFRSCFVDETKKMISNEITELNLDCPVQGLKPIIRFAYTGALVVTKRNAVATMIAAEATKMKEIQEICADIAVKEYGWLIHFVGEKDSKTIENLGKVLQMHALCFTVACSNGNHVENEENDLPFAEDVEAKFPDHATTYQRLSIKLKSAEAIVATSKSKPKENGITKPHSSESASSEGEAPTKMENASVTKDIDSPKPAQKAITKPARPAARVEKAPVIKDTASPEPAEPANTKPARPPTKVEDTPVTKDTSSPKPAEPVITRPARPPTKVEDAPATKDTSSLKPAEPVITRPARTPAKVEDAPVTKDAGSLKPAEPGTTKPARPPNAAVKKSKSDADEGAKATTKKDNDASAAEILKEKSPKKPTTPPTPRSRANEPANPPPPRPGHKKSQSDVTDSATAPVPNGKNPKRPAPLPASPAPKTNASDPTSPKPPLPNNTPKKQPRNLADEVVPKPKSSDPVSPKPPLPNNTPRKAPRNSVDDGVKIVVTSEENGPTAPASNEETPKKPPSSPKVKPRTSVKKKSAPAPPPPSATPAPVPTSPSIDKSPKAAPPRPKAPSKVPPPRPKPPSMKKNSNPGEQEGTPTKS